MYSFVQTLKLKLIDESSYSSKRTSDFGSVNTPGFALTTSIKTFLTFSGSAS